MLKPNAKSKPIESGLTTAVPCDVSLRFPLIDGLRGVAAMWVVLFHAYAGDHVNNLVKQLPPWIVISCFESGKLGVAIFFVLSGFVIAHSLHGAVVNPAYFFRFIVRRSLRLDPPYLVSIALVLSLAWVSGKIKHESVEWPSLQVIAAHVVYFQDFLQMKQINDVYWTLCYEIQFYICFCALLGLYQQFLPKRPQFVFVPAALVSLIWGLGIRQDNLIPGLFLSHWFAFLLGVFSYWAWAHKMNPIWFCAYAMCILSSSLYRSDSFAMTCVCTSVILLFGASKNWLNWRCLQVLGTISYSLYLLHNSVTGTSFFIFRKFLGTSAFTEAIMLIATVAVCILTAYIMWYVVERPFVRMAKRIKLGDLSSRASVYCAASYR